MGLFLRDQNKKRLLRNDCCGFGVEVVVEVEADAGMSSLDGEEKDDSSSSLGSSGGDEKDWRFSIPSSAKGSFRVKVRIGPWKVNRRLWRFRGANS